MSSGRKKLITKRIMAEADYASPLESGRVAAENNRYC
jgi:hypothetical protein